MINAFILYDLLCDSFEKFRNIKQQTDKAALKDVAVKT